MFQKETEDRNKVKVCKYICRIRFSRSLDTIINPDVLVLFPLTTDGLPRGLFKIKQCSFREEWTVYGFPLSFCRCRMVRDTHPVTQTLSKYGKSQNKADNVWKCSSLLLFQGDSNRTRRQRWGWLIQVKSSGISWYRETFCWSFSGCRNKKSLCAAEIGSDLSRCQENTRSKCPTESVYLCKYSWGETNICLSLLEIFGCDERAADAAVLAGECQGQAFHACEGWWQHGACVILVDATSHQNLKVQGQGSRSRSDGSSVLL